MRVDVRWLAGIWGMLVLGASAGDAPLAELRGLRDGMRQRLAERIAADEAAEPAREIVLRMDRGFARGPMDLTLLRQGGVWARPRISALPRDAELTRLEVEGLRTEADRVKGQVRVDWRPGEPADDSGEMTGNDGVSTQQIELDVGFESHAPELHVTLARLVGDVGLLLIYRLTDAGWVFDRFLTEPAGHGFAYRILPHSIVPVADGTFQAALQLEYTGDETRVREAYVALAPRIAFDGRLAGGRIDTRYQLTAPGGKHLLGTVNDSCRGVVLDCRAVGTYTTRGALGEWRGSVSGWRVAGPTALDALDAPTDAAPATVAVAQVYRQILALSMCLREYPMPLEDALNRAWAAVPAGNGEAETVDRYVDEVLRHARRLADPSQALRAGILGFHAAPAIRFGPYFGAAELPAGDAVGVLPEVTSAGAQQWRVLSGWRFTGPFNVFDETMPVHAPEVMPLMDLRWQRERLFDDSTEGRTGKVERETDMIGWIAPAVEQGWVYAPPGREASSGAMRYFCWYAFNEVDSAADQTVWVAMDVVGQAWLWLNDELLWASGPDFATPGPGCLQVRLSKGRNRLLVRCASSPISNDHYARIAWFDGFAPRPHGRVDFTGFRMDVCTAGGPDAVTAPTPADGRADTATVAGYRGDGSGAYAVTNAPLAWDLAKGVNVAWTTPVPTGTAEVVVHRGRLYLTAEPDLLLCIDGESGRELWRRAAGGNGIGRTKGNSAWACPVVNDTGVWVSFGTGVAAAYGLDGESRWSVPVGVGYAQANMGSPLLLDGLLIVQTHLPGEEGQFALVALDAATGAERWRCTGPRRRVLLEEDRAAGLGNGIAHMRLSFGDLRRTVLITGDGAVVDASDGAILHRDIARLEVNRAVPYVVGSTVYFAPVLGTEAVELWLDAEGRVGARRIYAERRRCGRGQVKAQTQWGAQHWMKGPVADAERLYVSRVDSAHVPQHWPTPWHEVSVYSRANGAQLHRLRGVLRGCTDPTVNPALAGERLYVTEGGAPVAGFHGTTEYGEIGVVACGPSPVVIARSRIGATRSAPVFDGERMFVRMFDRIVGLCTTPGPGEELQERVLAATVFEEVGTQPLREQVLVADPAAGGVPGEGEPVSVIRPKQVPENWSFVGPYPKATPDPLLRDGVNLAEVRLAAGQTVGGVVCAALDPKFVPGGTALDVAGPVGRKGMTVAYYYTLLDCPKTGMFRFKCRGTGYRGWLAGQELKDGQVVHLPLGYYPMLLRVELGAIPPFVQRVAVEPTFWPVESPEEKYAGWLAGLRAYEPWLRRIAAKLPGTGEAATAASLLTHLGADGAGQ